MGGRVRIFGDLCFNRRGFHRPAADDGCGLCLSSGISSTSGCRSRRANSPLPPLCLCVCPYSLSRWLCPRRHRSLHRRNYSKLPSGWVRSAKEVHEDMVRNFSAYPNQRRWLLAHPDSNIDHRRVPNLMVFFQRKGETLPITNRAEDYSPGDLVTWDLGGGVPHIGVIVDRKSSQGGRFMIVHNVGEGPKMEDVLRLESHRALSLFRVG